MTLGRYRDQQGLSAGRHLFYLCLNTMKRNSYPRQLTLGEKKGMIYILYIKFIVANDKLK